MSAQHWFVSPTFSDYRILTQLSSFSLDLDIKVGSLTCVIGSVGSGKTSLLAALLGELSKNGGQVSRQVLCSWGTPGALLLTWINFNPNTFPIVVIFFRGCVSEMVVLSYSVIYYIYIPGTLGPCFHYWCSVYGICKWSDTLWPVGRVRLFADYTISLSSLCRLIWKHWTTKMLVRYMMPGVCLRLRQFSQLSLYSLYGAVCLQLTQFSCDDRENVYFILLSSSNRKYESLTIV